LNGVGKNYKFSGIPTVALVDRTGVIRMMRSGFSDQGSRALEAELKVLLAEK